MFVESDFSVIRRRPNTGVSACGYSFSGMRSAQAGLPSGNGFFFVILGRALARTRNLEVLRCASAHHSSMLRIAPERRGVLQRQRSRRLIEPGFRRIVDMAAHGVADPLVIFVDPA